MAQGSIILYAAFKSVLFAMYTPSLIPGLSFTHVYNYTRTKNIKKNECHPYFELVQSMDDNCGEWVECMGVASGCGEQEVGVASGSGWNLWVWLLGVVLRRYIDFLILLIPTPLVSVLFCSSIPTFLFIF